MDLIRHFPAALLRRALADWEWVEALEGKIPLATSPFGDVFLHAPDGVWFLDLLEGALTREWDDPQALETALNTTAGENRYLLGGIAQAAFRNGNVPGPDQVLMFKTPPLLGGPLSADNVQVSDLAVALSILGQMHRQIQGR